MALVINSNIASLNAQRNLYGTQKSLSRALSRLSSGLRINSAKDDAAGLAISNRMTAQIRGLNQAVRNANDGISLAQTAEGALQQATDILQRMRELSVQALNDSNTESDRASLQDEILQLKEELSRIAESTQFNGQNILDGSLASAEFQIGAEMYQTISVSIGDMRATSLGTNKTASSVEVGSAATNIAWGGTEITVQGYKGNKNITIATNDSAKGVAGKITEEAGSTGVVASARTTATLELGTRNADATVSFKLGGVDVTASVVNRDLSQLAEAINAHSVETGVTAKVESDGKITLVDDDGDNIAITTFKVSTTNTEFKLGVGTTTDTLSGTDGTDASYVRGVVTLESSYAFSIVDTATGTSGDFETDSSSLSAVSAINVTTRQGAENALSILDKALEKVDSTRSKLGALQNRFEATISNLQNVVENLAAARSRILDADFASEVAEMTRAQILQQAGVAMLAQANQMPQTALSLLR